MAFDTVLDPALQPGYRVTEAAQILALPPATVRAWCFGHDYRQRRDGARKRFARVIEPASTQERLLSFENLCELHVLAAIRRLHRVKLPAVRKALAYTRKQLGVKRPLASSRFMTNGVELFVVQAGAVLNVTQAGQQAMREEFERALTCIEFGKKGAPVQLFPFARESPLETGQPKAVVVDPQRSFGRPVLVGAFVRTRVIEERFRAGDSITDMARDYGVNAADVEEAFRYEHRRTA